ncbi:MAG TPA: histidine phosphatase family protein [Patescibacteria group bacterium]|nr:histidine phosphatase family protein [Patescibacteria group bacterium]
MTTFYLIRHGLKEPIPFDPPLTEIGLKQAEFTAELLKDVEFKEILSSPKLRAKQTAEAIAKFHSNDIKFDTRLIERMEWEDGVTFDEFLMEWNKTDYNRDYQPSNGTASNANGHQMKTLVEELSSEHGDGKILIVTHGGTIGDLLRNLFDESMLPHIISPLTHAPYIDIGECSITIIEKNGDDYKLVKLGDSSHLSAPLT